MDHDAHPIVECITVDAVDPERLAAFWAGLLGLTVSHRVGPYAFLSRGAGLPGMGFQRVDESKTIKNRLHLDIAADDLDAATARVVALGGSRAPGYADGGFLVMTDPEGNEFCLLPTGEWHLDDHGTAHYPRPDG